jgi:hypothetical protein
MLMEQAFEANYDTEPRRRRYGFTRTKREPLGFSANSLGTILAAMDSMKGRDEGTEPCCAL